MNKFLRSVGLGDYQNRAGLQRLEEAVLQELDWHDSLFEDGEDRFYAARNFGPGFGVMISGIRDDQGLQTEAVYPYLQGEKITSRECTSVQRLSDRDAYSGLCEEPDLGLSLIYSVQNVTDVKRRGLPVLFEKPLPVRMAALAEQGRILLPTASSLRPDEESRRDDREHRSLLEKARGGDEEAMQILTMEDMELYSTITGRLRNEDVYSIVETSFMPYGLESDQYTVIGTIENCYHIENSLSKRLLWHLDIRCKDLSFPVLIDEEDLLGAPAPGRRFKGDIWMQGTLLAG